MHLPSTRYHRTEKPRIIHTPDEHAALAAAGWAETPAAFAKPAYADFPDGDTGEPVATEAATLDALMDDWQPPSEMTEDTPAPETDDATAKRILAADHAARVSAPKRKR